MKEQVDIGDLGLKGALGAMREEYRRNHPQTVIFITPVEVSRPADLVRRIKKIFERARRTATA